MPQDPAIFISYRRMDTVGHARGLYQELCRRFPSEAIFFDLGSIESGDVFPERLKSAVARCQVMLVLIGTDWLQIRSTDGQRRLDDPQDFVRQEVGQALSLTKKVIPVLFDDTPMPNADDLPAPLIELASCDALTLRGKAYEYKIQLEELVRLLAKVPGLPIDDLSRVKAMAGTLLEAGKFSWKMPKFFAPLSLETYERQDDYKPLPIDASAILTSIEAGDSLVVFGAGGIGKTTFLLDLGTSCFNLGVRIPIYVDVAIWARTNASLFDYLTDLPAAQVNNVTFSELIMHAETGRIVIMLNGWNEMAASSKLVCRDGIIQLKAIAEALNFVVVSRSSSDVPNLSYAQKVEVRGLTWKGQSAVIRAELDDTGVAPILDLLAKNTHLRHAARSPLILRGLIAQARKGAVASLSVFDLLAAAVQAFEENDQRNIVLSVAPVDGHHHVYLQELAFFLTQQLDTNCSRNDALRTMYKAATWLTEQQLIGSLPQPTAVLDVLVSHHLLHLDNGVVRFAHQRFQEYYAAVKLIDECLVGESMSPTLLSIALNQPAWHESLFLIAGKLKGDGAPVAARVRMVKAATAIDLGLACDLAGICAFRDSDDPELHNYIVASVNELVASPLKEVRDLGIAYQIASGLPAFADKLWPLLENENHQTRLQTYRMNGSALSLSQLGVEADKRVAAWPSDRRSEFVHEIAENTSNYEFLVSLARNESDPSVRAAAISALFWHFPASNVPLQAWLDAPAAVQIEHNVVSYILHYVLDKGDASDAVRERLKSIVVNNSSDQLQIALAFPDEVGVRELDAIFEHLCNRDHYESHASLVAIALRHAPERLLDYARELALKGRVVPEWVGNYLRETPVEVKSDVFEQAWDALQGPDFKSIRSEIFGPLANRNQIERCVCLLLQDHGTARRTLPDIDRERFRQLEFLLEYVPGVELLNVVMRRGQAASYDEAVKLAHLILRRIGSGDRESEKANCWLPTIDEVQKLIALFSNNVETAEVPQDALRVYLCSVASYVAPAEFGSFMIETCRRHLDAWSTFREKVKQWSRKVKSPRPSNPCLGFYLMSALAKWGIDALPGLLELMTHPSAMEFTPEAIARIVSLPWASEEGRILSNVSTDIQKGMQRRRLNRELRQPEDSFQYWTDEAAKALGENLNELVTTYNEIKNSSERGNAREAEYRVGRLASIVAQIPSSVIVDPIHRALASGLMNVFATVEVLRAIVRQGLHISDPAVVGQIESLYEETTRAQWLDDSTRYASSALSELIVSVIPTSLLRKPISHYLQQWRRFAHQIEIIRFLGDMHSETAWPVLLKLRSELIEKGRTPEEFTLALASALTPQNLPEFLALVADGTLFTWCRSGWTLERLAPNIAAVVGEEPGQIEAFVNACRNVQSTLSDTLAGEVLSYIKGCEETLQRFLLEALDAGRAINSSMPAYHMLRKMFTHKESINSAHYEITPKANNALRTKLYSRAKDSGPIADGCKCLLASLECGRRETAHRPDDEPRHPAPEEGMPWTGVLLAHK